MSSKKQKKQSGCMECKVVDSRFSSTSIDEAKLSVNSRLVIGPEETNYIEEKGEGVHGMFSSQKSVH